MSRFVLKRRPVEDTPAETPVDDEAVADTPEPAPAPEQEAPEPPARERPEIDGDMLEAKLQIHNKLIDELDLSNLDQMTPEELRTQIGVFVTKAIADQRLPMGAAEVKDFTDDIVNEMVGLGPLETVWFPPVVACCGAVQATMLRPNPGRPRTAVGGVGGD